MKVSLGTVTITWNMYFLNYVCYFMVDTMLILALPFLWSLWLFPMSMLSFSPNCWSCSWASQDLVRLLTPRPLMNASEASWMMCAMHGMWVLDAGHMILEASWAGCNSWVMDQFEKALSVLTPSKRPSVSSNPSRTSFKCMASLTPLCWPLTYYPYLAFEIG